ncbi:MAG: hypothetical protein WD069_05545 [Planctomycetales bacterium]
MTALNGLRRIAAIAALLAFLTFAAFDQSFAWEAGGGGVAARSYSIGFPPSPWLTVAQNGNGPIGAVAWNPPAIRIAAASWSCLFLAIGLLGLAIWYVSRRFDAQRSIQHENS